MLLSRSQRSIRSLGLVSSECLRSSRGGPRTWFSSEGSVSPQSEPCLSPSLLSLLDLIFLLCGVVLRLCVFCHSPPQLSCLALFLLFQSSSPLLLLLCGCLRHGFLLGHSCLFTRD